MLQAITMIMAVILMTLGYFFRRPAVAIGSAVAWLIFGLYSRSLSTVTWDIYYVMFILGVCMFFVAFIEGIVLQPKVEDMEPEEDLWDEEREEYVKQRKRIRETMRDIMGPRKPRNQRTTIYKINDPGPYDEK